MKVKKSGVNMSAIEIKHVTKHYGKSRGVIDINLSVAQGEFFGFIGPNGAGKSTTIRILLGMLHPQKGESRILELNNWKEKTKALQHIGYLPSESSFYPGMKVKDVCRLSAKLRQKDCEKEMIELSERLQLDLNKKVSKLSFGNKKKVAIVCALQHDPEILILDEPTSGLDPLMQKEFFEILKERHAKGCTIFLSSHVLREIQEYCQKAAIIKNGKIIACDSVEHLKQTNIKKVSVKGEIDLSALENVKNIETDEENTTFYYNGKIEPLLNFLAHQNLVDVNIEELGLEEIFMHYYQEEEAL